MKSLDISPDTSVLVPLHNQKLPWHVALAELCDNSFDAGASRVRIAFLGLRQLQVSDDGNGCDSIENMLTLGRHHRHKTTSVGQYGVGLKDAAVWLWGRTRINTIYRGILRSVEVNWSKLAKSDEWKILESEPVDAPQGEKGTCIEFLGTDHHRRDYNKIVERLSYIFTPAIRSGRQIVIEQPRKKAILCTAWEMPALEKVIQTSFEIHGKTVNLYAGVIAEGHDTPYWGFSFAYGHRMIMDRPSALGSKGRTVSRICGLVTLDRKWRIAKNKDGIVEDQDALEDAIWQHCHEIIEESSHQAEIISNSRLAIDITHDLQERLAELAKARRPGDTGKRGTQTPTGKGTPHTKATKLQPGSHIMQRYASKGIRMEWKSFPNGDLGSVDLPGKVIYLNKNHNYLDALIEAQNRAAITQICLVLLCETAMKIESDGQMKLFKTDYEQFTDALSDLLAKQPITTDRKQES